VSGLGQGRGGAEDLPHPQGSSFWGSDSGNRGSSTISAWKIWGKPPSSSLHHVPAAQDPPPLLTHLLSKCFWCCPLHRQLPCVLRGRGFLGQPEIADLCDVVLRDQDVPRRQVPVDKIVGFQVLHGFTDISGRGGEGEGGQRGGPETPVGGGQGGGHGQAKPRCLAAVLTRRTSAGSLHRGPTARATAGSLPGCPGGTERDGSHQGRGVGPGDDIPPSEPAVPPPNCRGGPREMPPKLPPPSRGCLRTLGGCWVGGKGAERAGGGVSPWPCTR